MYAFCFLNTVFGIYQHVSPSMNTGLTVHVKTDKELHSIDVNDHCTSAMMNLLIDSMSNWPSGH